MQPVKDQLRDLSAYRGWGACMNREDVAGVYCSSSVYELQRERDRQQQLFADSAFLLMLI